MELQLKKGDLVAVLLVLVLAVGVFLAFMPGSQDPGGAAQVYLDGKLIRTVSLDRDQVFFVEGDFCNTVTVKDGKIAVTQTDCPGADCVGCGWMEHSGRSIVCLPNRMEIRIISKTDDVDFVVG